MQVTRYISRRKSVFQCFWGRKDIRLKNLTTIKRWKYDVTIPSKKWITPAHFTKCIQKDVREENRVKRFYRDNGAISQKLTFTPIFTDAWKTARALPLFEALEFHRENIHITVLHKWILVKEKTNKIMVSSQTKPYRRLKNIPENFLVTSFRGWRG